jgi:diadenosine tetraphosphate (Ap4A) HIT family hydrolase
MKDVNDPCIFCKHIVKHRDFVAENHLAYAERDSYPVTEGHVLVMPKRHVKTFFELTSPEMTAIQRLINLMQHQLLNEDNTIEGFNIGVNNGEVAGQSVFHVHFHLIPRRKGDVEWNPKGGVRHVMGNDKAYYNLKDED